MIAEQKGKWVYPRPEPKAQVARGGMKEASEILQRPKA